MSGIVRPAVSFEIGGTDHQFEYGQTIVHAYRSANDQPFNHIEAVEYGTQRVFLFNCVPAMIFLSGIVLPGHGLEQEEAEELACAMEKAVGWESEVRFSDNAPEDVVERYIKLSTFVLRQNILYVPKAWDKSSA